VVWMHLRDALDRFPIPGTADYLPQGLALAVALEFAPISAGLIVAGRSGASLGAELGSMRLTEQLDALEVLGQSPLRLLVAPRVLACTLALPLLTVFIGWLGVESGYLSELAGRDRLSLVRYHTLVVTALEKVGLLSVVLNTLKTMVFGYLIGVTGCYFGVQAQGGTEGVGRAATRAVVVSIFLVLAADVALVRFIQLVKGL
jgi:phospholipid/cholesterol/gamma-HCH transport system permease protein